MKQVGRRLSVGSGFSGFVRRTQSDGALGSGQVRTVKRELARVRMGFEGLRSGFGPRSDRLGGRGRPRPGQVRALFTTGQLKRQSTKPGEIAGETSRDTVRKTTRGTAKFNRSHAIFIPAKLFPHPRKIRMELNPSHAYINGA